MPKQPQTFSPARPQAPRHTPKEADRQKTRALNTNSAEWKAIRASVLLRDGYRCKACGRLVVGRNAHVDHIDGDSHSNPTDGSNWQTLCMRGHSRKTFAEERGRRWDGVCEPVRGGTEPEQGEGGSKV